MIFSGRSPGAASTAARSLVDRFLSLTMKLSIGIPELPEGSGIVMAADGVGVLDRRVKDASVEQLYMAAA
jgi:hypothetical protein